MDPIGEIQVDTDSKADDEVVVNATKDVQQEDNEASTEVQGKVSSPTQQKETESSTENVKPVEEKNDVPSTHTDQESSAPEVKDDDNKDKESGKEKEKEKDPQPTQSKQWKNPRKKKSKDEKIPDSAQWPTLDEARIGRGPQKKAQGEPGKNSSKSEREKQSRAKKGINWKPLSDVKSQGTGEQSSSIGGSTSTSAVGGEGERGAIQGSGGPSSSAGSGRGYQGGYGRGVQPKRRGGGRGSWPRSHAGGAQHFSQEGANVPSENVAPETEGKDTSQTQSNQDSASSPPQAGQAYAPSESRRYRGSIRGTSSRGSSNRWRGGGGFSRPPYFNRYPPRGGVPPLVPPVSVPQDPEQLREQVKKQIEYYFGVDNLCKDIYLRKNMNTEGWISIHLILNFNRVRELGIDLQRFVDALKDSTVVEIKDEFVRRRDDWARWTFPPRIEGVKSSTPVQESSTTTESNSK